MKRKIIKEYYTYAIDKTFVFKWTRCSCGCNEEHMFCKMWRLQTHGIAFHELYSSCQYFSCEEFVSLDDLIDWLDNNGYKKYKKIPVKVCMTQK